MKYLDDTGLSLLWSKMKGLIPSSLPANGGNADTVDGKHYSDILCGSVKSAKMYVDNDTHIAKLGYFDLSKGEYSSTALMVGNGFWGNQHNCCELIIIGSDLYGVGDDDGVAKFTISKIHLGGSYERTLYYKVNGKKVEIYVACYGGNGYGKWFSKVIGSNESNLWYADFVENCSSADLTEIGYAGVFGSATKLANARTIAIGNTGKFFDGSGDVSWSLSEIGALPLTGGTLTGELTTTTSNIHVGSSTFNFDNAIKLGTGNAKISYFNSQVIFNTADALRFGHTDWDWDKWAGLRYDATNKIIYLGIADGSTFQANHAQSGGTLNLVAVDTLKTSTGNLAVSAATTLSSTLNVTGATTLASTLSVTGATTLSGKLDVSGVTTLKGRLTCSNLTVTNFISTNAMTYGVKILSWLTAADKVKAESTLEVAGETTLSSTLSVNGSAVLSGLTCSSLSVTGSTSLNSTLKVTGDTTLAANLSVGGTIKADTITPNSASSIFIGDPDNGGYVSMVEDMVGYDSDEGAATWSLTIGGEFIGLESVQTTSVSATNATIGTLTLTSGLKIQASSTKTYTFNMAKAISLGLIS